jgi:hypothetical protein
MIELILIDFNKPAKIIFKIEKANQKSNFIWVLKRVKDFL